MLNVEPSPSAISCLWRKHVECIFRRPSIWWTALTCMNALLLPFLVEMHHPESAALFIRALWAANVIWPSSHEARQFSSGIDADSEELHPKESKHGLSANIHAYRNGEWHTYLVELPSRPPNSTKNTATKEGEGKVCYTSCWSQSNFWIIKTTDVSAQDRKKQQQKNIWLNANYIFTSEWRIAKFVH